MQAPINILVSLARLHAAADELKRQLEIERDNAKTDYDRIAALQSGLGNDHTAMLLQMADDRGFHARRALMKGFGGFAGAVCIPQPEDLDYDAVKVIA